MKYLKRIAIIVGVMVLLFLALGLMLPTTYQVERSVVMRAKPDVVFPHVNTLKQWPEWTAWNTKKYPDLRFSFDGPESGVGAVYRWEGEATGTGSLKLTGSDPAKGIEYNLDFEHGKYLSKGAIKLEETGDSTKVTWTNEGDLGSNPINRYFGLMMDIMLGPDFEEGLNSLRQQVETK